jgi:hypothetical protein
MIFFCLPDTFSEHWTKVRMREFLDDFANSKGLNPLDPNTWYSMHPQEIIKAGVKNLFEIPFGALLTVLKGKDYVTQFCLVLHQCHY